MPKQGQKLREEAYRNIHDILLNDWDPLNVKMIPDAFDEYDSFIDNIYKLLQDNVTNEQIFETLMMIALEDLGVADNAVLIKKTKDVVSKFKAVKIKE